MKKVLALTFLFLALTMLVSGCMGIGGTDDVKSDTDAIDAMGEVSDNVDELSTDLDDMNTDLGSSE